MDGILIINKPKGYTSHDVVAICRKKLKTKKVGHTGTLDPNATGVLPICVGRATKLASVISGRPKTYRAVMVLGTTTDTLDMTGTVIETNPVQVTQSQIESAVATFQGDIKQIPPMYSAIKVDGVRLYKLARNQVEVKREARPVHIYDIHITQFVSDTEVELVVRCSSGTYIRTLCADIGDKLGCGAAMGDLHRLESGGYSIEQSKLLDDDFDASDLLPPDSLFASETKLIIKETGQKYLDNGNKISCHFVKNKEAIEPEAPDKTYILYDSNDKFYGAYVQDGDMLKPTFFVG